MHRIVHYLLGATFISALAVTVASAQPVEPGKEGELLNLLAARHGAKVCFARRYSAEHLANHSKQTVAEVEFRLTYYQHESDEYFPKGQRNYYFALVAKFKGNGKRLQASGECVARSDFISCNVECDGGGVLVRRRGGDKVVVYFSDDDSYIRMTAGCDEDEGGVDLKPGTDDKAFLLGKTTDAACPAYEEW